MIHHINLTPSWGQIRAGQRLPPFYCAKPVSENQKAKILDDRKQKRKKKQGRELEMAVALQYAMNPWTSPRSAESITLGFDSASVCSSSQALFSCRLPSAHGRARLRASRSSDYKTSLGNLAKKGCLRPCAVVASAAASGLEVSKQACLGDITKVDFPILDQEVNGSRLVYLDNAATSQKPIAVLTALKEYYEGYNANVHRGIHALSAKATEEYEMARAKVAKFINATTSREVVFTRNATEAINLVACTWGHSNLRQGDEILLSVAEHHSNLVPWQMVAQRTGAVLKFVDLTKDEVVDAEELKSSLSNKTKLVCVHHVSNTLGSINPVKDIVERAHKYGAKVLVDACQSVPHMVVDVQDLGSDFLVFSSHKMCGPTGVGVLHGKTELLNNMPPFMGGGEMISDVFLEYSTYAKPPSRFEAGTPAIGEAIGLGAAIDYLSGIGMQRIHEYEMELSRYLYDSLSEIPSLRIYGPSYRESARAALCAFNLEAIHPTDLSTFLDQQHGIAVRSGHHCTQPLHRRLGINASARASLYFYNTKEEVDILVSGIKDTISFFSPFN